MSFGTTSSAWVVTFLVLSSFCVHQSLAATSETCIGDIYWNICKGNLWGDHTDCGPDSFVEGSKTGNGCPSGWKRGKCRRCDLKCPGCSSGEHLADSDCLRGCVPCDAGTFQDSNQYFGTTCSDECADGFWSTVGASSCTECIGSDSHSTSDRTECLVASCDGEKKGSSCFKYFDQPKKWGDAETACTEVGMHLATIKSSDENSLVKGLITALAWIGINDCCHEGNFGWFYGTLNDYSDYSNWASGEPNNYASKEDCGEMRNINGQWNDNRCWRERPFVCSATWCDGSVYNDNSCFKYFSTKENHDNAEAFCQSWGGNLATITSSEENSFVQSLTAGSLAWIGLEDMSSENSYVWKDCSIDSYTNWDEGDPDDTEGECVYMRSQDGEWKVEKCSDYFPFVCSKT